MFACTHPTRVQVPRTDSGQVSNEGVTPPTREKSHTVREKAATGKQSKQGGITKPGSVSPLSQSGPSTCVKPRSRTRALIGHTQPGRFGDILTFESSPVQSSPRCLLCVTRHAEARPSHILESSPSPLWTAFVSYHQSPNVIGRNLSARLSRSPNRRDIVQLFGILVLCCFIKRNGRKGEGRVIFARYGVMRTHCMG
jgi:hypothetical protein